MARLDALTTAVDALTAEASAVAETWAAPVTESPTQAEVDAITAKVTTAVATLQAAVKPAVPPAEPVEPVSLG